MVAKAYLIGEHDTRQVARMITRVLGVSPEVVSADMAMDAGALFIPHGDGDATWIDVHPATHLDAHLYPGAKTMVSLPAGPGAFGLLGRLAACNGGLATPDDATADWTVVAPPIGADLDPAGEAFASVAGWLNAHEIGEVLNRIVADDCDPEAVERLFPFDHQRSERAAIADAADGYRSAAAPSPGA